MFNGVNQHLSVIITFDLVTFRNEPFFQAIAIRDVAIMGAVDVDLALHFVRLSICLGNHTKCRPADLAAKCVTGKLINAQGIRNLTGSADVLQQSNFVPLILNDRSGRVVAAIFKHL